MALASVRLVFLAGLGATSTFRFRWLIPSTSRTVSMAKATTFPLCILAMINPSRAI